MLSGYASKQTVHVSLRFLRHQRLQHRSCTTNHHHHHQLTLFVWLFRDRTYALIEEIHGVDIIVFMLCVFESEDGCAYIAYLDSVPYSSVRRCVCYRRGTALFGNDQRTTKAPYRERTCLLACLLLALTPIWVAPSRHCVWHMHACQNSEIFPSDVSMRVNQRLMTTLCMDACVSLLTGRDKCTWKSSPRTWWTQKVADFVRCCFGPAPLQKTAVSFSTFTRSGSAVSRAISSQSGQFPA